MPEVSQRLAARERRDTHDRQPDLAIPLRGPRTARGDQVLGPGVPGQHRDQCGDREKEFPGPRGPEDHEAKGHQHHGRGDLAGEPQRQEDPAGDQPASATITAAEVPAIQPSQHSAEHQRIGLKRPAVADRDRQEGKGDRGRKCDASPLPAPDQPEEAPGRQGRRGGRDDSSRLFKFQRTARHPAQADREELIDGGLDREVVREGCGVELGVEEPGASLQVPRDHRRRDLASDVVLDDRLIEADQSEHERPDQDRGQCPRRRRPVLGLAPVQIPRPLKIQSESSAGVKRSLPSDGHPCTNAPQNQGGAAKTN